uniref:Uncharacterized protein n=1 Tax=Propithecus coquereli TaxID=379532 RepID=A0A2K6FXT8_PROCO
MLGTSGDLRNDLLTPELRVKPCATPFPGPSGTVSSVAISCRGFTTASTPAVIHSLSEASAVSGAATLCFWYSTIKALTSSHQFGLILFVTNFIIFHTSARKEKAHHSMEELVCQLDGERHHIYLKWKNVKAVKHRHHPSVYLTLI